MSNELRAQLKSLVQQAENLRLSNEAKGKWDDGEAKSYESLLGRADALKVQLELSDKEAGLKAWLDAPDGKSAVKTEYSRSAAPHEGVVPGVASDPATGELYALDGAGETKVATLKSAAYKDAYNQYLRNSARFGSDWRSEMKSGAMKVLNEGSDTAGGFWVPPDIRSDLVKKMATLTAVRPNAFAFTAGSDVVTFPAVKYTTDDKYTSGARFGWRGVNISTAITETTNPVADRVNIPVELATAAIVMDRTQMEDNQFDLLGYVTQIMAEAFALGEEDSFINGTGVGQPQGILSHPLATTAHASAGMMVLSGAAAAMAWGVGTAGTATTTGITGIEAALPPQYEANAKWLANKQTYSALRALSDSQLRPVWNVNDAWPNLANGMAANLLGYPILKSQFMPDIASTAYPLLFGDFQGYYIADRVGLSVEVLREVNALKDQVVIYARKRVGGQLVHHWKMKVLKSNNS